MTAAAHGAAPARTRAAVVLGVVAAVGGAAALATAWSAPDPDTVALALGMHVLAALAARAAASAGGACASELDLVLVLAVAVPACGPGLLWLLPLGRAGGGTANAHAAFEAAELQEAARSRGPRLERELGVVSHAQVLQHGSLEEKRNLLRRIARLGGARYLTLLRQFLRDPEPELRLCAYAELARLCQLREEAIAHGRRHVEALAAAPAAERAAALAGLADANRAYAASGLLDADMAEYWLAQAAQIAERGLAEDPASRAAQRALACTLAETGHVDRAWAIAVAWPDDIAVDCELARAEIAFRRRDRGSCRRAAAVLRARGQSLPPWLEAVAAGAQPRGPGDGGGGAGADEDAVAVADAGPLLPLDAGPRGEEFAHGAARAEEAP